MEGKADRVWERVERTLTNPSLGNLFSAIETYTGDPNTVLLRAQKSWGEAKQKANETARQHWDNLERIQSCLNPDPNAHTNLRLHFTQTPRNPSVISFTPQQIITMGEAKLVDFVEHKDPTDGNTKGTRGRGGEKRTDRDNRGTQASQPGPVNTDQGTRPAQYSNDKVPDEEKDRRRREKLCIKCGKGPHFARDRRTGWYYRPEERNLNLLPVPANTGKGRPQ